MEDCKNGDTVLTDCFEFENMCVAYQFDEYHQLVCDDGGQLTNFENNCKENRADGFKGVCRTASCKQSGCMPKF